MRTCQLGFINSCEKGTIHIFNGKDTLVLLVLLLYNMYNQLIKNLPVCLTYKLKFETLHLSIFSPVLISVELHCFLMCW